MEVKTKVCPHCGSSMFAAKIIRGCIVESNEDGTFKIMKESTNKYDIEIVKCGRCKKDITEDDLVTGVTCKECGKVVNPSEIGEDGICDICKAKKERSELANASTEDLIRMLLKAEKMAKSISVPTKESVQEDAKDTKEDTKSNDTEEETKVEEESSEPEKKTRRRKVKKNQETENTIDESQPESASEDASVEEKTSEENAEQKETEEAVNDIANQQEAPFPDIPMESESEQPLPAMNPPETSGQTEESFGVSDFEMFKTDEKF